MRLKKILSFLRRPFRRKKKIEEKKAKRLHEEFTREVLSEVALKRFGLSRDILARIVALTKEGKLIYRRSIRGDKIRYFRKYRRWVAPKGERLAIWSKPILIASPKKHAAEEKLIAARHKVYSIKAGRRGKLKIAKKNYFGVRYRPPTALREFVILVEALRRKVPVVEPLRVDVNWQRNEAALYTRMPPGFKDLSTYNLKDARTKSFIRALATEVAKLHNKGILHGDLRRPNILWNGSRSSPEIKFLDFETGRLFKERVPINKAIDDIILLTESLCGKWQGLGNFGLKEMEMFADIYCKFTGFPKEVIMHNIKRAIPKPESLTVADYLRERLLRGKGIE